MPRRAEVRGGQQRVDLRGSDVAELDAADLGVEVGAMDLAGAELGATDLGIEVLNLYPTPSSSSLSISLSAQSLAPPTHARTAASLSRPSHLLRPPSIVPALPSTFVRPRLRSRSLSSSSTRPGRPCRPLPSSAVTGGEGGPHRSKAARGPPGLARGGAPTPLRYPAPPCYRRPPTTRFFF